jgi:hypothetical protein
MRTNVAARNMRVTHEGAPAVPALSAERELRRSVLSCLLGEDEFYENGTLIRDRIAENAQKVRPNILAAIAIEARERHNLRHAPLLLLEVLTRTGRGTDLVAPTIARVIQRADELGEFVAIYTHGGDRRKAQPGHGRQFSNQTLKGLRLALRKFDGYGLAKYDRDGVVKLRDVLRIVHPKPKDEAESELFKGVRDRTLAAPDTWEVALSAGADKKETFERMLREQTLGYLALLRNLRNMAQAGVDPDLVKDAILARKGARRVLPFRYVAAARAAPQFEPQLDKALVASIAEMEPLAGRTIVLVDVSGSMDARLSRKSDMNRMDAAATLASIIPGDVRVFTFSDRVVEVPPRRGMAGVDAIKRSQEHSGTYLGAALARINRLSHDRLIVVTDEQSHDPVGDPAAGKTYMINVASYRNGVGYGRWTHIDGFSESVLRFIRAVET